MQRRAREVKMTKMILILLLSCSMYLVFSTDLVSSNWCSPNNTIKIRIENLPDNKYSGYINFLSDTINISSIKYDAWEPCEDFYPQLTNNTFQQIRVMLRLLHLTNEEISCDQLNKLVHLSIETFPFDYYYHFGQFVPALIINQSLCESDLKRLNIQHSPKAMSKVIRNESFCQFNKLKYLSVSISDVWEIEADTFICLENLIEIDLHMNKLSSLPQRVFSRNRRLRTINLSSNRFTSLKYSTSFLSLPDVSFLDLSSNLIEQVSEVIPQLKGLDLKLGEINRTTFSELEGVKDVVDITLKDELEKAETFRNNPKVKVIYLKRVPKIDNYYFPKLEVLDLSHNKLSGWINLSHVFENRVNLTDLQLNFNKIEGIIVDESSTNITNKSNDSISNLRIDLSYNRIQSLRNLSLTFLDRRVTTLDVRNNRIQTVCVDQEFPFTADYKVENVLHLSGNPLQCDCANIRLKTSQYQKLISDFARLECSLVRTPLDAEEKPPVELARLDDDEFRCRIEFNRSEYCICYGSKYCSPNTLNKNCYAFSSKYEKKIINVCENISEIPAGGYHFSRHYFPRYYMYFKGIKMEKLTDVRFDYDRISVACVTFYLENSDVRIIEKDAFNQMRNLEILSLRSNRIRVLPDNLFQNLTELKELYLSNNRLITLAHQTINNVIKLELHNNSLTHLPIIANTNQLLLSLNNLTKLSLHDNPWSCECDFVQLFHAYLGNNTQVIDRVKDINCVDRNEYYNVLQFDLSKCKPFLYLTAIVTSTTFAVVIIIIAVLIFIYRREVRVLIYSRYRLRIFGSEVDDDVSSKQYDAFVAYNSKDEDFLINHLMPGLEAIPNPYRLCIHERDFPAGAFIQESIMRAVELSSRTIVLLTENFVDSGWCRMEFMTAHAQMMQDRCPRVLLIVLGEIPRNLDPEMEVYLRTNTYLKWGERLFWEKLYYAMPDQRVTTPPTEIMPMDDYELLLMKNFPTVN